MDKETLQSYIAIIVGVLAMLGIILVSDEICWGADFKEFKFHNKEIPVELMPSPWEIKQMLDEHESNQAKIDTFYEQAIELISHYTSADFNITPTTNLHWQLNKIHCRQKLHEGGTLFSNAKFTLKGYKAELGYTWEW